MALELAPKTFKTLSSNTRISILKKLREKPRSLSSLAQEMGFSVQSTHEQLEKLRQAGLVFKTKHAKWMYYQLSESGQRLVTPSPTPAYVLLGLSLVLLLASAFGFMTNQTVAVPAPSSQRTLSVPESAPAASGSGEQTSVAEPKAMSSVEDQNAPSPSTTVSTITPTPILATPSLSVLPSSVSQYSNLPWLLLAVGLACLAGAAMWWWQNHSK